MKFRFFSTHAARGTIRQDMTIFITALVAVVLLALISQTSLTLRRSVPAGGESVARVTFVFSPEKTRRFVGEITPGLTVADALQIASSTGHLSLIMDEKGQPVNVDGVEASWGIYQNGRLVTQPSTDVTVSSGDDIHVVALE